MAVITAVVVFFLKSCLVTVNETVYVAVITAVVVRCLWTHSFLPSCDAFAVAVIVPVLPTVAVIISVAVCSPCHSLLFFVTLILAQLLL